MRWLKMGFISEMRRFIFLLTLLIILLITMYGCDSSNNSYSLGTPKQTISYENLGIKYEITGSAWAVNITLNNPTGGTEQYSNVRVPHSYIYHYFPDHFLYISAQNCDDYGSVTVKIYVDGVAVKSATSSGGYTIATASGYY